MSRRQYLLQLLAAALLAGAWLSCGYGLFTLPRVPDPSPYSIEPGGAFALFFDAVALTVALLVVLAFAWWRGVGAVVVGIAAGGGLVSTVGILSADTWLLHAIPGLDFYIVAAAILCALSCTVATSVVASFLIRR